MRLQLEFGVAFALGDGEEFFDQFVRFPLKADGLMECPYAP